jgi:hypothetical protein
LPQTLLQVTPPLIAVCLFGSARRARREGPRPTNSVASNGSFRTRTIRRPIGGSHYLGRRRIPALAKPPRASRRGNGQRCDLSCSIVSRQKSFGSWLTKTTVLPHFPRTMALGGKSSGTNLPSEQPRTGVSRQVPADAGAFYDGSIQNSSEVVGFLDRNDSGKQTSRSSSSATPACGSPTKLPCRYETVLGEEAEKAENDGSNGHERSQAHGR